MNKIWNICLSIGILALGAAVVLLYLRVIGLEEAHGVYRSNYKKIISYDNSIASHNAAVQKKKIEELEENSELPKDYSKLWRNLSFIVLGLACLIIGSNLFVDAASYVAHRYGVRQSVIGLTIVAGGTSLPELATSVVAAYKGRSAIAIGNVLGSNVFNILLVLGTTAVIHPMRIMGITIVDLMMMLVSVGILWLFAYTKYSVSRKEGVLLILGFLAYMGWLLYLL